jgi:Zn-dependent M28 family amino/carboxypeptidase
MLRLRIPAATALALTVLSSCVTAPVPSTPLPSFSVAPGDVGEISADRVREDLQALEEIAAANGGNRAAGSSGYAASVDYVVGQLREMGYTVSTPVVDITAFRELPGSRLAIEGGATLESGRDFRAMLYSAAGDLTAPLATVGFPDSPGGEGNQGCDADDFAGFPAGAIAITPPGPCFRRQTVQNAVAAGAVALLAVYADREPGTALRPTLISPEGMDIPALTVVTEAGDALLAAVAEGKQVSLRVNVELTPAVAHNVIAEPEDAEPGGRVAMVGAHLDSVLDGPGVNDDGSGVAAVLEIARTFAEVPGGRLRVVLWAGEEYGIYGSRDYVESLADGELQTPIAYLNLDMLGSLNGVPFVYDDSQAADGSDQVRDYLLAALTALGVTAEPMDLGGASDHAAFQFAGIPTGGIFSGAAEKKTADQASAHGGTADEPMDACYHLPCDTTDNVDADLVAVYAAAIAQTARALAEGELLP